jgi:hypothetical protein
VPVQGNEVNRSKVFRAEFATQVSYQQPSQQNHTNQNVDAVQSSQTKVNTKEDA